LEELVIEQAFWQGKKVLVTGHTGFKGSWLALWLQQLGADVLGVALAPEISPNLFTEAKVADKMQSVFADINDLASLQKTVTEFEPEVVVHMAAQALVRQSYKDPIDTYQTNVMGTLNVLETIRSCASVKAAVMVTTDKCYDNKEWVWPYREQDTLGGYDPYSSSKACAEILIDSYRRSFFAAENFVAIASVRAGNVIGGGDWSPDRLIPDIIRAKQDKQTLEIRYPTAIRPWQHVLEPLSAYLLLAQALYEQGEQFASAWNIGPNADGLKTVEWIANKFKQAWPDFDWQQQKNVQLHEANTLKLDCSKIQTQLNWHPKWPIDKSIELIIQWHDSFVRGEDMKQVCLQQIDLYQTAQ
jgi:CDP-glucose 4,6-dehydratase